MTHLSVVIPVYQAVFCIEELFERLTRSISKITGDYEIIMVNDGSTDMSWTVITDICRKNKKVKGINFSRNFGQHNAIAAGLDIVSGEWTIVMDCDLQDRPEEIVKLYREAQEGFEVVVARRVNRNDGVLKKMYSRLFYVVFNYFTDHSYDHTVANFGIYSKKAIKSVRLLQERHRFLPTAISWVGFKRGFVEVDHGVSPLRKSTYNLPKLIQLGLETVISYSNKPLILFIQLGFTVSFFSFLIGIAIIIRYFVWQISVVGWASIIVSIYFIGGIIFTGIGLLGLYIGKIFEEVKRRPIYIVKETRNVYTN